MPHNLTIYIQLYCYIEQIKIHGELNIVYEQVYILGPLFHWTDSN